EVLLREAAEDYGSHRALAAEFDSAVLRNTALAGATKMASDGASIVRGEGRSVLARHVPPSRLSKFLKAASATLLAALAAPMRSRIGLGALATALLVAVLVPGLYGRFVEKFPDWSAALRDDAPSPPIPPTLPAPTVLSPAPGEALSVEPPAQKAAPQLPRS